jgi:hypothetical protein
MEGVINMKADGVTNPSSSLFIQNSPVPNEAKIKFMFKI